jgi:hypothetical protein
VTIFIGSGNGNGNKGIKNIKNTGYKVVSEEQALQMFPKRRASNKKRKLNKVLLRKVLQHIQEDPKRYNNNWHSIGPWGNTASISGWTVILAKGGTQEAKRKAIQMQRQTLKGEGDKIYTFAKRVLGLSEEEANSLFTWTEYQDDYDKPGVERARLKIDLLLARREHYLVSFPAPAYEDDGDWDCDDDDDDDCSSSY